MQLGLTSILTIIFVIAKITHYIDWSWWLVFSPTIAAAFFIFIGIVLIAAGAVENPYPTRRK